MDHVVEALNELNRALSIVGKDESTRLDGLSGQVGAEVIVDRGNVNHLITIEFSGNAQPEVAGTVDGILTTVLNYLHISEEKIHNGCPDKGGETRIIRFALPVDKTDEFSHEVRVRTRRIGEAKKIKEQFRSAIGICLQHLNGIEGLRAHIKVVFPRAADADIDQSLPPHSLALEPPPFLALEMEGVPTTLANKLAGLSDQRPAALPRSGPTVARDFSRSFVPCGKDITIPLNHAKILEMINTMKDYVPDKGSALLLS